MPQYAIAVKRSKRDQITLGQAVELIEDIEEMEIVGDGRQGSVMIIASDRAITEVARRLKSWCHIEALIRHFTQLPGRMIGLTGE